MCFFSLSEKYQDSSIDRFKPNREPDTSKQDTKEDLLALGRIFSLDLLL